jgi:hypothetical protein
LNTDASGSEDRSLSNLKSKGGQCWDISRIEHARHQFPTSHRNNWTPLPTFALQKLEDEKFMVVFCA